VGNRASPDLPGANIRGKPRVCLVYLGGAPAYRQACAEAVANDYEGFIVSSCRLA
jgi:cyclohexanone monooxygenase